MYFVDIPVLYYTQREDLLDYWTFSAGYANEKGALQPLHFEPEVNGNLHEPFLAPDHRVFQSELLAKALPLFMNKPIYGVQAHLPHGKVRTNDAGTFPVSIG